MKKNIVALLVLVALLVTTFLTGCDNKEVNTASPDQIVSATEETKAPTEVDTEEETEAPTEAPTEKETEADKDNADDTDEDENTANEQNNSGSASNTSSNKNTSNGSSSATTTNKKTSSSSSSSSNSNLGSSSSSNSKPSSNSSSNSSSSSSSSSNKKPSTGSSNTTTVVTDDTPIPHSQLCTDANMQKVTSAINNYFINLGMVYNPSLNHNECGWFYDTTSNDRHSTWSVNEMINREIQGFESEVNGILLAEQYYSDGETSYYYTPQPSDYQFYCYSVRQSDGEYDIYFCYS